MTVKLNHNKVNKKSYIGKSCINWFRQLQVNPRLQSQHIQLPTITQQLLHNVRLMEQMATETELIKNRKNAEVQLYDKQKFTINI